MVRFFSITAAVSLVLFLEMDTADMTTTLHHFVRREMSPPGD